MARRRDIERLSEEIEELFSGLWQVPRLSGLRRAFRPDVDCYRTADPPALTVVVDIAGVDRDSIHVDATPEELVVHGERRRPDARDRVYQQAGIEYGPFQVGIPLVAGVDTAAARATYEQGLLTIVLPVVARTSGPVDVPIHVEQP